ncbi:MAG: hypothetical protein ACJ746_17700 [Bryobacteraceae bacterium]
MRLASSVKSLQAQPGSTVLVINGPYMKTNEHIGGCWVLEPVDLDQALQWTQGRNRPVGRPIPKWSRGKLSPIACADRFGRHKRADARLVPVSDW